MTALTAVLRPENTLIWLPQPLADRLGAVPGQRLTRDQWQDRELTVLIAQRTAAQKARKRK